MSYSQMLELLKLKHKGKILLVKTGAFYVATAEDAIFLHDTIGLKCTCFKNYVCKVDILYEILNRKIKDKKLIWLIKEILYSNGGKTGLAIGNYTSQVFANIYLNEVDQYVKHKLKQKYYYRYMDDSAPRMYNK